MLRLVFDTAALRVGRNIRTGPLSSSFRFRACGSTVLRLFSALTELNET